MHAARVHALVALAAVLLSASAAWPQTVWQKYGANPIVPAAVGGGYALNPSVLADTTAHGYKMWFTGQPFGAGWSISAAISVDGIAWYSYVNNPILESGPAAFETDGVMNCDVIYDGTTYKMYYTGIRGCCTAGIGLATSTDGVHWSRYAGNPVLLPSSAGWDGFSVGAPRVYFDGTRYYMYYRGNSSGLPQTGLATSSNGVDWTKDPLNPVLPRGPLGSWDEGFTEPGGVFVHNGTFYLTYTGGIPGGPESIGLASSPDGIAWTRAGAGPVLSGSASGWDGNSTSGAVIVEGNRVRMWYSGNPVGGPDWSIGLATADLGLVVQPGPSAAGLMQNRPNPFAVATEIRYEIAQHGPVRLQVFDLAGRVVSTLADEVMEPGVHSNAWVPRGVGPGIYFCSLASGGVTKTTKMLLTR